MHEVNIRYGDSIVDDNDNENVNNKGDNGAWGYPLMKRMLITVPEGIQPSEVGHHGSVESNCGRDPPFNEDFYK